MRLRYAKTEGDTALYANKYGRVFSLTKNGLNIRTISFGKKTPYGLICVRCNKRKKFLYAHEIVCLAWHGKRPDGCEVDHINRRKIDNRACNLRWVTHSENLKNRNRNFLGLRERYAKRLEA